MRLLPTVLLLVYVTCTAELTTAARRRAKFLDRLRLFTIFRFPNSACTSQTGDEGSCYSRGECALRGGENQGQCARGYGVCCTFYRTCGERTDSNGTYFINPGFSSPQTTAGACYMDVYKINQDVCQLRIDFDIMQLRGPINGQCVSDMFAVSGNNNNNILPLLCGVNSGQHLYVETDQVNGPIQLMVLTSGEGERRWKMKVTQLECTRSVHAPANCLQYHMGQSGTITSFNYETEGALVGSQPGYTNNLNYAICVRREMGFCSVTYTNPERTFGLINYNSRGEQTTSPDSSGAGLDACPTDYIVLNGLRLCGEKLNDGTIDADRTQNTAVTDSCNGPFIIQVRSDGVYRGTTDRGFKLNWQQNPCTSR